MASMRQRIEPVLYKGQHLHNYKNNKRHRNSTFKGVIYESKAAVFYQHFTEKKGS